MIQAKIKLHQFVFLHESKEKPGDGTILIAWEGEARYWWVHAPRVDGVEYYPPPPEHRIVDPQSIAVGLRSHDYVGVTHPQKRIRLASPPVKLLAALEKAKSQQQPRIIIRQRWRPIFWIRFKAHCWRAWRRVRDRSKILYRKGTRWFQK